MTRKKRNSLAGPVNSMANRVVFGRGVRGPALQSAGLRKIAEDYIRAGIRGADLIQRFTNSSGADPAWACAFLKEHYANEIREE